MDGAGGELEQLLGGKRVVSNLQRPELLKHRIGGLAQTQDRSGDRTASIQSSGMGCFLGAIHINARSMLPHIDHEPVLGAGGHSGTECGLSERKES
jgi:hypothetical protein